MTATTVCGIALGLASLTIMIAIEIGLGMAVIFLSRYGIALGLASLTATYVCWIAVGVASLTVRIAIERR